MKVVVVIVVVVAVVIGIHVGVIFYIGFENVGKVF